MMRGGICKMIIAVMMSFVIVAAASIMLDTPIWADSSGPDSSESFLHDPEVDNAEDGSDAVSDEVPDVPFDPEESLEEEGQEGGADALPVDGVQGLQQGQVPEDASDDTSFDEPDSSASREDGNSDDAASLPVSAEDLREELDALAEQHRDDLADGVYSFAVPASPLVLDAKSAGTENGTIAQLYKSNATDAQAWSVSHDADGYVVISNEGSGLLLTSSQSEATDGSQVYLWERADEGDLSQKWIAIREEDGAYRLVSAQDKDLVLGTIDGSVEQNAMTVLRLVDEGSDAQTWEIGPRKTERDVLDLLAKENADVLEDGSTFFFRSGLNSSFVLDVYNGSMEDEGNVQLYTFNGTSAQQWVVSHDDIGYVTLTSARSGKILEVAGESATSGANVWQNAGADSYAQKWIAIEKDGGVCFVSALDSSLVLDVYYGSAKNGSNVQVYSENDSDAQVWQPENLTAAYSTLDSLANANRDLLDDGATYLLKLGVGTRQVIDVKSASASNGANVQSYVSNMTSAQKWVVSHDADGYVTFTNVGSGKVLDVAGGKMVSKTNIAQYESNGSRAQKWVVVPNDDANPLSGCTIYSALYPNMVLDVYNGSSTNGANVQLYAQNGTAAQRVTFINTAPSVEPCEDVLPDGWYYLAASGNSAYVVDVYSGLKENGTKIQLHSKNATAAQLFSFEYEDGYYTIVNAGSGKALDVADGEILPPATVQLWQRGSSSPYKNQRFTVVKNGDGTYTFVSKSTGLALDIKNGSLKTGNSIQAYTPNGSAAQKFKLVEQEDLLKEGIYRIYPVKGSGRSLNVKSGSASAGATIQAYDNNGTLAQKWQVSLVDGQKNTYTIENLGSGLRLASDSKGAVSQQKASSSKYQQWIPAYAASGSIILKNAETGKVLDIKNGSTSSGAIVQTYASNGTDAQRFYLSTTYPLANGTYLIRAKASSGYVLDVKSGSMSNGAKVQLYKSNDTGAQKWVIGRNSDGSYRIANAMSDLSLDVPSGKAVSGVALQQYAKNNTAAQKWIITYEGGGGFKLASGIDSSFVVDISGASYKNGTKIGLYASNNTDAQRFTFKKTTYDGGKVLGVSRDRLVKWLESHENDRYYLGTRYSSGFTTNTCMYPNGAPRSDGFTGMNCTGFVAHVYRSVGGNLNPIATNNNHSPWAGGPGGGSYINAWRWYGYAIDSGAEVYTFKNVAAMLSSGKAEKGDIIFFKTNGAIDCHIGFFWGDNSHQNRMWHQILPGNLISTCYNNANHAEISQQTVLIKGRR